MSLNSTNHQQSETDVICEADNCDREHEMLALFELLAAEFDSEDR